MLKTLFILALIYFGGAGLFWLYVRQRTPRVIDLTPSRAPALSYGRFWAFWGALVAVLAIVAYLTA
jgi:hypothetical protein